MPFSYILSLVRSFILFFFLSLTPSSSIVTLANDSSTQVKGLDGIHPTSSLTLSSMLYLPQFLFKLMAIRILTKNFQCQVTLYIDSCIFQDLATKMMIGRGREVGGCMCLKMIHLFHVLVLLPYIKSIVVLAILGCTIYKIQILVCNLFLVQSVSYVNLANCIVLVTCHESLSQ